MRQLDEALLAAPAVTVDVHGEDVLAFVAAGNHHVEQVLEGGKGLALAAYQQPQRVRGIVVGAVDIEHLRDQADAVACGLGVAGRDLGVGESEQRQQIAQRTSAEIQLILGLRGGSGRKLVGGAGNGGGRGCGRPTGRLRPVGDFRSLAATAIASAATTAAATASAAPAALRRCRLRPFLRGDADDRFLGAEAEEALPTFADDVDVDLIAAEV